MSGTEPRPAWAVRFPTPVPYADAARLQGLLHAARLAGRIPDTILLLEHPPVVTLGRRGREGFLRRTPAELAALGIGLYRASRGGDVTWHGPGQWVLYPILKLDDGPMDAHGYLHALEETAIRTAADFGVRAFRRKGMNGAWTARGKIAAIGFHIRRWVTLHGLSFNAEPDLAGFATIVPCGLEGEPVASLRTLLGDAAPPRAAVGDRLLANAAGALRRRLDPVDPAGGPPAWRALAQDWRRAGGATGPAASEYRPTTSGAAAPPPPSPPAPSRR